MFDVSLPSEADGKKQNPSIIDMANAAYSMTPSAGVGVGAVTATDQQLKISDGHWSSRSRNNSASSTNLDERLDAARAMLGISPCSVTDGSVGSIMGGRGGASVKQRHASALCCSQRSGDQQVERSFTDTNQFSSAHSVRRPRSNSAGLEALAFLASQEQEAVAAAATTTITARTMTTTVQTTVPYSSVSLVANPTVTSSDDDSEIMPPPPPRTTVTPRRRSVSNPEGMDKWGLPMTCSTMDYHESSKSQMKTMRRLRLVLPVSILEEEIAEANAAVIAKEKSTASASALAASLLSHKNNIYQSNRVYGGSQLPLVEEEDDEDENLNHDELLRRARSRLLEDLSQSNLSGEKGVLTLPHSLRKYKEVYNKNGRIGIYTPAERAAIIARFQSKRTRRVWNKKIRYNCRKNLADRRLRVKGRFVKRTTTTTAVAKETRKALCVATATAPATTFERAGDTSGVASTRASSAISSIPEDIEISQGDNDTEMPDVSDPDAGFCPTSDQPYRRVRRHTIT